MLAPCGLKVTFLSYIPKPVSKFFDMITRRRPNLIYGLTKLQETGQGLKSRTGAIIHFMPQAAAYDASATLE
jgi:hypothetical protein